MAGTPADLKQAQEMKEIWLEQGLDRVDIVGYDVLLSYPEDNDPSVIKLFAGIENTIMTCNLSNVIIGSSILRNFEL